MCIHNLYNLKSRHSHTMYTIQWTISDGFMGSAWSLGNLSCAATRPTKFGGLRCDWKPTWSLWLLAHTCLKHGKNQIYIPRYICIYNVFSAPSCWIDCSTQEIRRRIGKSRTGKGHPFSDVCSPMVTWLPIWTGQSTFALNLFSEHIRHLQGRTHDFFQSRRHPINGHSSSKPNIF